MEFSSELEKINNFRKQALYYSKEGKRFKVLIETVTGCFGNCLGCALTENDRTQFSPKISPHDLPDLFKRLTQLLDYTSDDSIVGSYETTVINYGGSEHFIYDNQYLGQLFKETSDFFNSVKTSRNVLAFSSSGLLNADKMQNRSQDMLTYLDKDQFVVDFVIDLARFDKLRERYQKSFDFFNQNFGFVDLAININSSIDTCDWKAFCEFVDQNGILNLDLIYSLNKNNAQRVAIESQKIFNIYETIINNTKGGKGLFDLHGLLRIKPNEESLMEMLESTSIPYILRQTAKTILRDAIFINSEFQVYPVLFVIFADVPLNERLDIKPIGNLFDSNFKEKFIAYEEDMYQMLLKSLLKSKQCGDCDILKSCYQTGAPLLNSYLNSFKGKPVLLSKDCQNPVRPFLLAKNKGSLILKEDEVE